MKLDTPCASSCFILSSCFALNRLRATAHRSGGSIMKYSNNVSSLLNKRDELIEVQCKGKRRATACCCWCRYLDQAVRGACRTRRHHHHPATLELHGPQPPQPSTQITRGKLSQELNYIHGCLYGVEIAALCFCISSSGCVAPLLIPCEAHVYDYRFGIDGD